MRPAERVSEIQKWMNDHPEATTLLSVVLGWAIVMAIILVVAW